MKLIVLSAFCVIAFTTFSEVAGFDSAEKEDVSEIQNGTYSSGELKDIDYDLDTTRGPVDPSNPPTAPTPAGPVPYTTEDPAYYTKYFPLSRFARLRFHIPRPLRTNNHWIAALNMFTLCALLYTLFEIAQKLFVS
ncbi:uncharacterized protein LOC124358030 isoform X6 [Homalodisca vitripennis]|uniref:uncharacterized protein LOC124358030 isoform X6 n=1 Tax=Homalodisca vitripennis TaxID=197043 RepID=UPI001EEC9F5C|nr:uncharacterized protein LOC124358030 isoform X6 [Homalodisca vitripennis]